MELTATVKKVLRPAAERFTTALTRAIEARLSALEQAHGETWAQLQALKSGLPPALDQRLLDLEQATGLTRTEFQELKTWVPAVLDASSDQHAATRATVRTERLLSQLTTEQAQRLQQIEERVEFIRRELMFELRYGARSQGIDASGTGSEGSPGVTVEPKVLNEAKLRSFGDDIRLNVGAGHVPVEGYLNVDARELDGIDILADIRSLPFGPGDVSTIYCAHLLEHFPVEEVRRSLLPYWRSLLKPGGRMIAVVPDTEAMLDAYNRGDISFADLREVTFGGQEYDGDFHFNMYSKESLTALLADGGFGDVAITGAARRNGLCFEMQVEGVRTGDAPSATGR
jgi:SAM-dependent methyltransferase